MALKTGIVGMPNVGKVGKWLDSVLPSVIAQPSMQTLLRCLLHAVCTPGVASQLISRSYARTTSSLYRQPHNRTEASHDVSWRSCSPHCSMLYARMPKLKQQTSHFAPLSPMLEL